MVNSFQKSNNKSSYSQEMTDILATLYDEEKDEGKLINSMLAYGYRKVEVFTSTNECENRIKWLNNNGKEYIYGGIYKGLILKGYILFEINPLAADTNKILAKIKPHLLDINKKVEKDIKYTREGVYHIHTMSKDLFNRIYHIGCLIKNNIGKHSVSKKNIDLLIKAEYNCLEGLTTDQVLTIWNINFVMNKNIPSSEMTYKLLLDSGLTEEIVKALRS